MTPFWRHKSLKLLPDDSGTPPPDRPVGRDNEYNKDREGEEDDDKDGEGDDSDDEGDDDGDEEENVTYNHNGCTFEEVMESDINLILEFVKGLK